MAAAGTSVVDLAVLRRACDPLTRCYERFLTEGRLEVHELDAALVPLRGLPQLGGRLGRAVALLVAGGAGEPTEATLAALELFRTTSGLRPAVPAPIAAGRSAPATASTSAAEWTQPPLPGLS